VVVLGLLVTFLAIIGVGAKWLLAEDGTRSTAVGPGGLAAAAQGRPTDPAATTARPLAVGKSDGPLTFTASGPGHLATGSDPSVLPGPILIADEKNNRLLIIDPHGRSLWQFPRPGDLAPGQTFTIRRRVLHTEWQTDHRHRGGRPGRPSH
jgi:hypothetical protein